MKPEAIVYTSKTGHTKEYAAMLGEKTGLSVCSLDEAVSKFPKGSKIIYFGWLFANRVKGLQKAMRRFSVCAVCGVGLCDTGTLVSEVRKASSVPEETPLFTLQGGFRGSQLKGVNKLVISMLKKGLESQKKRTEQDERILQLIGNDASYVSEENLQGVFDWYLKES